MEGALGQRRPSPWPADGVRRARRIELAAGGSRAGVFGERCRDRARDPATPRRLGAGGGRAASQVDLRITADGVVRVEMPLADFFAEPPSGVGPAALALQWPSARC